MNRCAHCGGAVMETVYLGGEVDRACLMCGRGVYTAREVADREAFVARASQQARLAVTTRITVRMSSQPVRIT